MSGGVVFLGWLVGVAICMGIWAAVLVYRDEPLIDHPEIIAAVLWPLAAITFGVYWLTGSLLARRKATIALHQREAAEQSRLLREAGLE